MNLRQWNVTIRVESANGRTIKILIAILIKILIAINIINNLYTFDQNVSGKAIVFILNQ